VCNRIAYACVVGVNCGLPCSVSLSLPAGKRVRIWTSRGDGVKRTTATGVTFCNALIVAPPAANSDTDTSFVAFSRAFCPSVLCCPTQVIRKWKQPREIERKKVKKSST